mgnify:FL=1
MSRERLLLAQLLAETDAIFYPMRGPFVQRLAKVRFERQKAFRTVGLTLAGSGSATARKQHERCLTDLEAAGLVEFGLDGSGRREGVRLSPLGDACTRRLIGGTPLAEAWPIFASMCDLCRRATRAALPEHLFCNIWDWKGGREQNLQLSRLQQDLLAFFAVAYVDAHGDFDGKLWYGVTEAGREALAAGCPEGPPASIEYSESLAVAYDAFLDQAEAELRNATPKLASHVVVPVPMGVGWGGCYTDWFLPGQAPPGSVSLVAEEKQ